MMPMLDVLKVFIFIICLSSFTIANIASFEILSTQLILSSLRHVTFQKHYQQHYIFIFYVRGNFVSIAGFFVRGVFFVYSDA